MGNNGRLGEAVHSGSVWTAEPPNAANLSERPGENTGQ